MIIDFSTLIIGMSLIFYFIIITYQVMTLVIEGFSGKLPKQFSFPSLWQNMGVVCTIAGVLLQRSELVWTGAMFIALRIATSLRKHADLHPAIEIPLLVAGILSFGSLGMSYFFG